MVANACQYIHCTKTTALCWIFDQLTLEGTNISHQKKRKVIFESTWVVDMLLSWRVLYIINPYILSKTKAIYNKFFVDSFLNPPLVVSLLSFLSTKISRASLRPSHPDPVLGRDRARRGSIACEGCHTESPRNHKGKPLLGKPCWMQQRKKHPPGKMQCVSYLLFPYIEPKSD